MCVQKMWCLNVKPETKSLQKYYTFRTKHHYVCMANSRDVIFVSI